ncbi:MAG: Xaa-Pro peptidase family protein [Spirochaetes bacterium]|nr:Xaa-Pro peptidase family protein [Spirochaetota bacterium]
MDSYASRRARLASWLKDKGISAALLEDTEGRRDPSVRYLSGQPGDALLVVFDDGRSVLVPWDANMAAAYAHVDQTIPYADFARSPVKAFAGVLERCGIKPGAAVELPDVTPYPSYIRYVEALEAYDPVCREDGVGEFILGMRAVKDNAEIGIYRRAAALTDALMDEIEHAVVKGSVATELDIALFIERELRARGGERSGFDTIAAGPARSFGIHAFPSYTSGAFGTEGMSILDFGIVVDGYTTDVTMSFVRGSTAGKRSRMIELVKRVYDETVALCAPGRPTMEIARRADDIFAEAGFTMPHALGHGIGMEAHEAPAVRNREDNAWKLAPGHIVTIEPGLYDPEAGGIRLENDILVTEKGGETITHSRIVML